MATQAFWINADRIVDVGERSHIQQIIDQPDFFGLTEETVTNVYKKHGERLYVEGAAREELIKSACQNGWIRVRQYARRQNEYWSIQFDAYHRRKKVIQNFVVWALTKGLMTRSDLLVLVGFEDNYYKQVTSSDLVGKDDGRRNLPRH